MAKGEGTGEEYLLEEGIPKTIEWMKRVYD